MFMSHLPFVQKDSSSVILKEKKKALENAVWCAFVQLNNDAVITGRDWKWLVRTLFFTVHTWKCYNFYSGMSGHSVWEYS